MVTLFPLFYSLDIHEDKFFETLKTYLSFLLYNKYGFV